MAIFYIKNDFALAEYSSQYDEDIMDAINNGYSVPFFHEYVNINLLSPNHIYSIIDDEQIQSKETQPRIKPENYWSIIQRPALSQNTAPVTFFNNIIINSIDNNCESDIADIINEDIATSGVSHIVLDSNDSNAYQSSIFTIKPC